MSDEEVKERAGIPSDNAEAAVHGQPNRKVLSNLIRLYLRVKPLERLDHLRKNHAAKAAEMPMIDGFVNVG
jgi:hypothetical protein